MFSDPWTVGPQAYPSSGLLRFFPLVAWGSFIIIDSNKTSFSADVNFGNDLKELIWIGRRSDSMKTTTDINAKGIPQYNNHFDYVSTPSEGHNMFKNFTIYSNPDTVYKRNLIFMDIIIQCNIT